MKKLIRFVLVLVALVLVAAVVLGIIGSRYGLRISEARYIETEYGNMLLLDNSPVSMSGNEKMFDGLTTGDKVLVVHGLIAESYPGQAKAYLCIKLEDGTEEDIPQQVRDSLREMGWLPTQPPVNEEDAIGIATQYAMFEYYAATAEQDLETGDWTVTLWSRSRENFQVLIISSDGAVRNHETGVAY